MQQWNIFLDKILPGSHLCLIRNLGALLNAVWTEAPDLPGRGYTWLSPFVLILVHHLLTDPFSTSLQLVSPISSLSLWEYVDCADIYAENSWLFCHFWSKMLRSFPFQPSGVERPGLFLLGVWNPLLPWTMWVYDAHLCCLRLPLQNIFLWLGWSTVLLCKKKIMY